MPDWRNNLWVASSPLLELGDLSSREIGDGNRFVTIDYDGSVARILGCRKVLGEGLARCGDVLDSP